MHSRKSALESLKAKSDRPRHKSEGHVKRSSPQLSGTTVPSGDGLKYSLEYAAELSFLVRSIMHNGLRLMTSTKKAV